MPLTPEQLAIAQSAFNDLANNIANPQGICFLCKQPVERKEQVDRCVFFIPCGHHYQGKLRESWEGFRLKVWE